MKIFILFIVLVLSIQIVEAQKYKAGEKAYSYALSALKIRETADAKGKLLDTIPYGDEFTVLPMSAAPVSFTLDGIPGHWIKVKYKNVSGFLFDGYSTRYPPPAKEGEDLTNYFKRKYTIRDEKTKVPDCPDCRIAITTADGVKYIHKYSENPP